MKIIDLGSPLRSLTTSRPTVGYPNDGWAFSYFYVSKKWQKLLLFLKYLCIFCTSHSAAFLLQKM